MEEKKKNEELQNRREFFKNAAKKALPILGAIALAGAPILSQAAEKEPMECSYCHDSCYGYCRGGCTGSCNTSCYGSCQGSCQNRCQGSCSTGCGSSSYYGG